MIKQMCEKNMTGPVGSAVNLNIEVTQVSEGNVNIETPVSDWEDEYDEEVDSVSDDISNEWDNEEADVEAQMAEVRAAAAKVAAAKAAVEEKQQNNHAKQVNKNAKKYAGKPKLDLGKYTWLYTLTNATDGKIAADAVFARFGIATQKRIMALVVQSRDAIDHRSGKVHEKVSALAWDGGGQGDESELQIVRAQSKKLIARLDEIWRTGTGEASSVSESMAPKPAAPKAVEQPVEQSTKPVEPVAKRVQQPVEQITKPVEPVTKPVEQSVEDDESWTTVQRKKAIAANIKAMIGIGEVENCESPIQEVRSERECGFDLMAQARQQAHINPTAFTCSRPCEEFKTGKPCRHRAAGKRCNWGHCIAHLKPRECAWPTSCKKMHNKTGACECAHVIDGVLETGQDVMNRLYKCGTLKKMLPPTEHITPVHVSTAPVVSARMNREEQRDAARAHRAQLEQLNKKIVSQPEQLRKPVVDTPVFDEEIIKEPVVTKSVWTKPPKVDAIDLSQNITARKVNSIVFDGDKKILRCSIAMAMEMLESMSKTGVPNDSVTLEIIQ